MVVTSSTLGSAESAELKNILHKLGGHFVPEWKEKCDYVVMEKITLTIKVTCAVLAAKFIVTPAFFKDYLSAVETKKTTLPKPQDFMPPIVEAQLINSNASFAPNKKRTTIYKEKLFLFENAKVLKKIGICARAGGGEAALITSVNQATLKHKNTIIVGSSANLSRIDEKFKTAIGEFRYALNRKP